MVEQRLFSRRITALAISAPDGRILGGRRPVVNTVADIYGLQCADS